MRNAGLEETQTRIKIAGRNINNLRYVDREDPLEKGMATHSDILHGKSRGQSSVGYSPQGHKKQTWLSD